MRSHSQPPHSNQFPKRYTIAAVSGFSSHKSNFISQFYSALKLEWKLAFQNIFYSDLSNLNHGGSQQRCFIDSLTLLNTNHYTQNTSNEAIDKYLQSCAESVAFQNASQNLSRLAMRLHYLLDNLSDTYSPLINMIWICNSPVSPRNQDALAFWGALRRLREWNGAKITILFTQESCGRDKPMKKSPDLIIKEWGESIGGIILKHVWDPDLTNATDLISSSEREHNEKEMNYKLKPSLTSLLSPDMVWESTILDSKMEHALTTMTLERDQVAGALEQQTDSLEHVFEFEQIACDESSLPQGLGSYIRVVDVFEGKEVPSYFLSQTAWKVKFSSDCMRKYFENRTGTCALVQVRFEHAALSSRKLIQWQNYVKKSKGDEDSRSVVKMENGPFLIVQFCEERSYVIASEFRDFDQFAELYLTAVYLQYSHSSPISWRNSKDERKLLDDLATKEEEDFLKGICETQSAENSSPKRPRQKLKERWKMLNDNVKEVGGRASNCEKSRRDVLSFKKSLRTKPVEEPVSELHKTTRKPRKSKNLVKGSFFFSKYSKKDEKKFLSNIFWLHSDKPIKESARESDNKSFELLYTETKVNPIFGVDYCRSIEVPVWCKKLNEVEELYNDITPEPIKCSALPRKDEKREKSLQQLAGKVNTRTRSSSARRHSKPSKAMGTGKSTSFRQEKCNKENTRGNETNNKNMPSTVSKNDLKKQLLLDMIYQKVPLLEPQASSSRCQELYNKLWQLCIAFGKDKNIGETSDAELATLVDRSLPNLMTSREGL